MEFASWKFNILANKIVIYAATALEWSAFRRYSGSLASKSVVKAVSCSSLSFKISWRLAIKTSIRMPSDRLKVISAMLSVLIMTKQEISSLQGSHYSDMTNKLSCITGIQRKKHFKNISHSRNQRLGYWHWDTEIRYQTDYLTHRLNMKCVLIVRMRISSWFK